MKDFHDKKYSTVEIASITEMAEKIPAALVEMSEGHYNKQVFSAAEQIKDNPAHKFVLLCGPSASGKTTTAFKLKEQLTAMGTGAKVVSMDNFFLGVEAYPRLPDGKPDMESVKALDLDLLNQCFEALMRDGKADLPVFDFTRQSRSKETHHIELGKGDVLIMEGIHALNPDVLKRIPRENVFRIYVSVRSKFINGDEVVLTPKDIRLMRRMVRDHKFRNWPPLSTLEQWTHVLQGERVGINPYRDDVDLKMDNTIDYEVCVWHDLLIDLLKDKEQYSAYPEIDSIFKGLMRFPQLDYKLIPGESLLREFIGEL